MYQDVKSIVLSGLHSRWFMVAVVVENMKVWRLKKGYWCGALVC